MIAEIAAGVIKGMYDVIRSIVKSGNPEKVTEHIDKNEFIQQRIEEILSEIKAGRVYVCQFHNGGYFYSGNPMQKFSVTYEAVNGWVAPIMGDLQNRLVSEYPAIHSSLLNTGEYYLPDVKVCEDNTIRQKLEKRGITTFYAVGIWDFAGNKLGNVSVNYVGQTHEMTEQEKEVVKDFANQLVGYIVPTEPESSSLISKIIMVFLGLTCASQLLYFLNNFFTMVHSFGPMLMNVLKSLTDFL